MNNDKDNATQDFDIIITDNELSEEWRTAIENENITLYCE